MSASAFQNARRAEALGARLPPLLVAAQRVANTVAQGVHGRRRVGQGDSFWQFRPFAQGDSITRIDWRASAKSDRNFIRETEWEAAQTVYLWRDGSPSMDWRSGAAAPFKRERADLILLALAALLLRGGERVRLLGGPPRLRGGRFALEDLAEGLSGLPPGDGVPPKLPIPAHARVILIGDFLHPLDEIRPIVAAFAATSVAGYLLQILDPAETLLPYSGRVRFQGLEREADTLVPRVEGIRDAYATALQEQQTGLAALAAAADWRFATHRTDHSPEAALLAAYTALSAT
ncbi:MAG: DUF58 domain-containing protein [Janthinobacterium lividum]